MNRVAKRTVARTIALIVAGAAFLAFAQGRKGRSAKKHRERIVPIASQISVQNGRTVITVSPQAQDLAGITTAPLKKTSARRQITAPAVILSVESLAKFCEAHVAAEAQLAKARAREDVSRKEYARMKSLYQNKQNASQKALQSAKGAFSSDQADVQAAQQELQLEGMVAGQKWGSVVEQWIESGAPILNRVLDQKTLLVEVTVPTDKAAAYPARTELKLPGGKRREAVFVSAFPRVDPRIQGAGLLYRTSAYAGLAPGANLVAQLVVGKKTPGVLVPLSAVVWTKGRRWVYEEIEPGRFSRRLLETAQQQGKDLFVPQGFSPGGKIVVKGAQVLLSEEFRDEIQPED
ncbi:MAG TPA: hypothetical protein VMW54_13325 [Terriglobia bacterium]|nr:hypothetical protein [Terriglobia bacterium]